MSEQFAVQTIPLHGLHISNITMAQPLDAILDAIPARSGSMGPFTIFTPNAEIVMQSVRTPALRSLLNSADLLLPDGAGVVLGAKILGTPLKEKVSGIDVAKGLLTRGRKQKLRFFLFGGKPGVAEQAAIHMLSDYPGIQIVGTRNGYFDPADTPAIVEQINRSRADIAFVCLGAPKQEQWIMENRDVLACGAALGLGGSLDVFAGTGRLAPEWMRRAGLEWLFRLVREPRRWRRMLDLPRFVLLTFKVKWAGRQKKTPAA